MEKNLKKNIYICVYIYMNHFAVHWKLTQYCKSALLQYKIKIKLKKGRGIKLQRLVGASLL